MERLTLQLTVWSHFPGPAQLDNVFIERLWRSLKYEDIYLKGYADGHEAKAGITSWVAFYNTRRPHQARIPPPWAAYA